MNVCAIIRLSWKIATWAAGVALAWAGRNWKGIWLAVSLAGLAGFMYIFPEPGRALFRMMFWFAGAAGIAGLLIGAANLREDAVARDSVRQHTWHAGKAGKKIPGTPMQLHPVEWGELSAAEQARAREQGWGWETRPEEPEEGGDAAWGVEYEK